MYSGKIIVALILGLLDSTGHKVFKNEQCIWARHQSNELFCLQYNNGYMQWPATAQQFAPMAYPAGEWVLIDEKRKYLNVNVQVIHWPKLGYIRRILFIENQ